MDLKFWSSKKNIVFIFHWGWCELHKFYNLKFGVRITLVYLEPAKFCMHLKDKRRKDVSLTNCDPPWKFIFHRSYRIGNNIIGMSRFHQSIPYHPVNVDFQSFIFNYNVSSYILCLMTHQCIILFFIWHILMVLEKML